MSKVNKTVQYVLTNADATVTGLAASSTVTRYLRAVHAVNATASPATINFGVGATLTGPTGADIWNETIAANSRMTNPLHFGGAGKRVDNTNVRAFSNTGTAINITVNYDEVDNQ